MYMHIYIYILYCNDIIQHHSGHSGQLSALFSPQTTVLQGCRTETDLSQSNTATHKFPSKITEAVKLSQSGSNSTYH